MMRIFILTEKKGPRIKWVKILVRRYWPHMSVIHKVIGGEEYRNNDWWFSKFRGKRKISKQRSSWNGTKDNYKQNFMLYTNCTPTNKAEDKGKMLETKWTRAYAQVDSGNDDSLKTAPQPPWFCCFWKTFEYHSWICPLNKTLQTWVGGYFFIF